MASDTARPRGKRFARAPGGCGWSDLRLVVRTLRPPPAQRAVGQPSAIGPSGGLAAIGIRSGLDRGRDLPVWPGAGTPGFLRETGRCAARRGPTSLTPPDDTRLNRGP